MSKATQFAEGAAAISGLALEVGGFAISCVGEKLKSFAENPQKKGEEIIECVGEKGKDLVDKGTQTVKKYPWVAMIFAFGMGFLLLRVFRKKKK